VNRLIALAALLVVLAAGLAVAEAAGPTVAQVDVLSAQRSGDTIVYRLRVRTPSRRLDVLVPYAAAEASLEVNGVVRERTGSDFPVGNAPLGHGAALLSLADVGPRDTVLVRVRGSPLDLRFIYKPDVIADAHAIGFWSGVYYAVLCIVAFFIVVAICVVRDPAMAWYLAFTLSLLAVEIARDDILPFGQPASIWMLLAASLASSLAVLGFFSSYLRLREQTPVLFAQLLFWSFVPVACSLAFTLARHRAIDDETFVAPYTVGLIACLVIATIRRRSGYRPATFIAIGFLGLTSVFLAKIVRDLFGPPFPFLDRWGFEFGSVFDLLAFAVAVTIRARYSERERIRMQSVLQSVTYEADHDDLTGLLNRRGLEARYEELSKVESTVLYVDLDGFKAINDKGGHAAGDDALRMMARILRHAVRAGDVVARVGGDEFLVVLVDFVDPAGVRDVTERISSAVSFVHPLGATDPTRFGVSIGHAITALGQPFSVAVAAADAEAYRVKSEHYATSRELKRRA